jgi:hypothetical protein
MLLKCANLSVKVRSSSTNFGSVNRLLALKMLIKDLTKKGWGIITKSPVKPCDKPCAVLVVYSPNKCLTKCK